ncbi:MAG: glutamine-hydrolyzing GMP synthase [Anaerolineales bacterium]|nr:glutamine-hydrolyzing GMP synthase [Anaerolineales bacterium]
MTDSIAILDFGSQYAQLIARRVREAHVYCELFAWDAPADKVLALKPKGFILSGGPRSVYENGAPFVQNFILESRLPILGICYGMQALTQALGGEVNPSSEREYGPATVTPLIPNSLISNSSFPVWMSHGDRITQLPAGFIPLAKSDNSPLAAMSDVRRKYFGVQFHPEVRHTPDGGEILRRFVVEICGASPDWTPASIIEESVTRIRAQVGSERALAAVSGGVDSSVAAALVQEAIGDQLVAVFVDTGLLRQAEPEQVVSAFRRRPIGKIAGAELVAVDAAGEFLSALRGITDPEQKRKIVGEKFIRIFEAQARKLGQPRFLVQGTIYPDVVESSAPERDKVERIKTHHNVGGLPEKMRLKLIEPLRFLFKDEVRKLGKELKVPYTALWRQPFPGPGLAVRIVGEVTEERLRILREADYRLMDIIKKEGLYHKLWQSFAVLLPVKTVGVMGDRRTYENVIAIRAVTSADGMTADWARLSHDILAKISNSIINEVKGVNRVVYDISTKPPSTIEWE